MPSVDIPLSNHPPPRQHPVVHKTVALDLTSRTGQITNPATDTLTSNSADSKSHRNQPQNVITGREPKKITVYVADDHALD